MAAFEERTKLPIGCILQARIIIRPMSTTMIRIKAFSIRWQTPATKREKLGIGGRNV
jgi:hypothetical protein